MDGKISVNVSLLMDSGNECARLDFVSLLFVAFVALENVLRAPDLTLDGSVTKRR